ncbi:nucleoside diphosphate kinase IV/mitochondrial-like [Pyrus ussuriensis x Pyrus communis]|uniref:nucleoside-diphosphate kinase n=2 Tax=Pyrus TaxID=3766 RepID=A0A5N5G084_9ROSA|nr:nucleoside diphosphate kinase IV/mitochondrial-like [Pyrus ussuriensis x Pyrus communis]
MLQFAWYVCCILSRSNSCLHSLLEVYVSFMDDGLGKLKIVPDHFKASEPNIDSFQDVASFILRPRTDNYLRSRSWSRRKLRSEAYMLKFFSLRGLPWGSSTDGEEKVELTAVELESLRTDLADLEEKEAHLKAQLEHVDEILRSARLSGYLYIRTRWKPLPGEPPPLDDTDVDDWLPRFVVLQGPCIFFYLFSTDLSPQDSTLLADIVEVSPLPSFTRDDEGTRHAFCILTSQGLRFECSSASKVQVDSWLSALRTDCELEGSDATDPKDSSASRAARSFLSTPKASSRSYSEGRAVATAAAAALGSKVPLFASSFGRAGSDNASRGWISGALAIPAAAYMLVDQEVHAAELERTFIAIKPDGVQRGLIAEIISRFERKGFKLVGIKVVVPTKDFAQKHYHDLKERPFFSGLCDFLSSGPVIAMVWEGEGVIKYGRKLIGATDPQKSEPGTIRGDLAVVVGRNIIHGSDGPETAKDEINLWFTPSELVAHMKSGVKVEIIVRIKLNSIWADRAGLLMADVHARKVEDWR